MRKLEVKSWAYVSDGCPIGFCANDCNVDFVFGSGSDTFEFGFDLPTLRQFLRVATEALGQFDQAPASS